MTNGKATPEVRFKGFSDDWEQRKVKDIAKNTYGGGTPQTSIDSYWNGEIPWIQSQDIIENQLFNVEPRKHISEEAISKSATKLVPKNSIAIVTRVGVGKLAFMPFSYCTSQDFLSLSGIQIDEKYATYSIYQMLQKEKQNVQGTSIKGITIEEMLSKKIELPCDRAEQEAIGVFFQNLDNLITLHQRKLDKITKVKKAMLEKMFPKSGSNVPEIRFEGFTDDWEQRKLGDVYQNIGNAFVGTATPYYVEDGHFYLESNNVKDGQINHITEIFINDEFYEKQKDKWLHAGDMVMVQSGHVGHAAVIPKELDNTAAHALIMFKNPKMKIEPYFLNYQYQTLKAKKKIENITTGNTIKHILASDMQEFVVDITYYEEQIRIAQCFQQLDNLITLHQRKLEKLQNIKKSMLEKMFPTSEKA